MRLSEYAAASRARDSFAPRVLATLTPMLAAFGAGEDPDGWLIWSDDVPDRWTFLAPTVAGLITSHVRVNVPGEGPRSSVKVSRWGRVAVGELSMESTPGGHRVASFQLDSTILRGGDADADTVASFALAVFAAMDGRPAGAA